MAKNIIPCCYSSRQNSNFGPEAIVVFPNKGPAALIDEEELHHELRITKLGLELGNAGLKSEL